MEYTDLQLARCSYCGRHFSSMRIEKHQQICARAHIENQLKQYNTQRIRLDAIEKQKAYVHEPSIVYKAIVSDMPVQCQRCQKLFNKDYIQSHYNICSGGNREHYDAAAIRQASLPIKPTFEEPVINHEPYKCPFCSLEFEAHEVVKHCRICEKRPLGSPNHMIYFKPKNLRDPVEEKIEQDEEQKYYNEDALRNVCDHDHHRKWMPKVLDSLQGQINELKRRVNSQEAKSMVQDLEIEQLKLENELLKKKLQEK